MAERIQGGKPPTPPADLVEEITDPTQKRIAELEALLEASKSEVERANEVIARNKAAAQSQAMFGPANTEVHVGEDEDGEPIFMYRIDLPPSGGEFIRINGYAYNHGDTYKFNQDLLRTVKEIVFRSWGHESAIKGENENAYRRPKEIHIGGRH